MAEPMWKCVSLRVNCLGLRARQLLLNPVVNHSGRNANSLRAHIPRKRFGQHFLTDMGIVEAIVRAVAPKPGQRIVEIGPGLGALTQPLSERLGHLIVVELDRDLAARLRSRSDLTVIESDVLKLDFAQIAHMQVLAPETASGAASTGKLRVVGNLPYNISTPILFHLFAYAALIADQHFMLQKEVVDRMVASPASSSYGRLSIMLQWRYAMENVLSVPPASFEPQPRVDSAVVRMIPRADPVPVDAKRLEEIVRVAFGQRRKLLRHTLGKWLADHAFAGEFDLQRRAEEVSVAEYIALALRA